MQQSEKGESENSLLSDLEVEGDLTLLLVHALIGQPPEDHLVGGVIRIDGYADASGDGEGAAVDADRFAEGANDAGCAGLGDGLYRLIARQVRGDDDELVTAEAGEGVRGAYGVAEVLRDVLKEFVADIVAVGVVDDLEAVEVDHEENGAGVVVPRQLDGCGEAIFKETAVGKSSEVVVEGVPLVDGDLLLKQNEKHTNGDEELLEVPYLIGDGIVSRMVGDPGVEEEDERPNDEADDDGNFTEAFAGQTELEEDSCGEILNEEDEIGCVAKRGGGGEEPDGDPGAELDEENPPASAEDPGASDSERADDAEEETTRGDSVVGARIMDSKAVDGEQRNRG
jgi:hypothetical protein